MLGYVIGKKFLDWNTLYNTLGFAAHQEMGDKFITALATAALRNCHAKIGTEDGWTLFV